MFKELNKLEIYSTMNTSNV